MTTNEWMRVNGDNSDCSYLPLCDFNVSIMFCNVYICVLVWFYLFLFLTSFLTLHVYLFLKSFLTACLYLHVAHKQSCNFHAGIKYSYSYPYQCLCSPIVHQADTRWHCGRYSRARWTSCSGNLSVIRRRRRSYWRVSRASRVIRSPRCRRQRHGNRRHGYSCRRRRRRPPVHQSAPTVSAAPGVATSSAAPRRLVAMATRTQTATIWWVQTCGNTFLKVQQCCGKCMCVCVCVSFM